MKRLDALPTANGVVALDPETGAERWRHIVSGAAPSRRGVAYWPGEAGNGSHHLHGGPPLIALDATTGKPLRRIRQRTAKSISSCPTTRCRSSIRTWSWSARTIRRDRRRAGNARAFDARTGAKLWEFSSVAQPGSVGHDTWEGDSWKGRFGANAWPFYFTLDEQRGLLYLPLASPIPAATAEIERAPICTETLSLPSMFRPARTSGTFKRFITILWDADPPAPPGLFDIVRNGRRVPAMALTTKSGYMYILNRETGQPIFGVEERPVPKSDVPGERRFPTQPIPVKPPALARVGYRPEDLVTAADTTPEHAAACRELIEKSGGVYNAGPFTPWKYREAGAATPMLSRLPRRTGRRELGRNGVGSRVRVSVFVATQDVGALGFVRRAREGAHGTVREGRRPDAAPSTCRSPMRAGPARNRHGAALLR